MNKKTVEFKNRIKKTISEIYDMSTSIPIKEGFCRIKKGTLFRRCGKTLINMGIIKNKGNVINPRYVWDTECTLSDKIFENVYDILHAENRMRISSIKKTLPKLAKKTEEEVYPIKPLQSSLVLVSFTDQQLWDELKRRDYSIRDNQLCKLTYLQ